MDFPLQRIKLLNKVDYLGIVIVRPAHMHNLVVFLVVSDYRILCV